MDMVIQPRVKPYQETSFFADGQASRPVVAGTIARGQLHADRAYATGKEGDQLIASIPAQIDRAMLERGRQRFDIYCAPCHDRTGDGHGMIVQRGFPAPPSFHEPRLIEAPSGHYFNVITNGHGVMYSYASRVSIEDRWAITAYIRALQLSRHASLDDVPSSERARLEEPAKDKDQAKAKENTKAEEKEAKP